MKVLLEMRPALDGHSGIPQETRLLFRGLDHLDGIVVEGLIQSSNLVLDEGLPMRNGQFVQGLPEQLRIDRLSRVVVSLQQGAASRWDALRKLGRRALWPLGMLLASLLGLRHRLSGFESTHFKDYIWRAMFEKSLPAQDFERVTAANFRLMSVPWSLVHAVGVLTARVGRAIYPRLDTSGADVLLVETPFPGRVSGSTRLVVRYHDAIPLLMPHTISNRAYHRAAHFHALRRNALDGAWFACVSEATQRDLLAVMPEVAARTVTIPNMVSHHFFREERPADRVPEIIWSRKNRTAPFEGGAEIPASALAAGGLSYLLMVCTIEPRKNHVALLDAWEQVRSRGHDNLQLVFVGGLGWDHDPILKRCRPWLQRGGLHLLEAVPASDLRLLYRYASVTVCPSFGEGFDFPGVEAMRSGGIVAASDIPVHRDVFGEACEYFSPYSTAELSDTLLRLLDPAAAPRRAELREVGATVSQRYLPEVVLPQWSVFLESIASPTASRP